MIIIFLYVIAAITILIAVVSGFYTGSFLGFLLIMFGGVSTAIIMIALAMIIEYQERIYYLLQYKDKQQRKLLKIDKKECTNCQKKHDFDMNSCPYCGFREPLK
ncbi:hypothetical protein ACERII_20830 [Evansella sp. AB-rgal1]|uniref:hypothetical protein n=1 Tax=Evansella sp. AB-rgal1 TaxID=3242696 RepID=UPI00359D0AEB